jgi:hypothetical protein
MYVSVPRRRCTERYFSLTRQPIPVKMLSAPQRLLAFHLARHHSPSPYQYNLYLYRQRFAPHDIACNRAWKNMFTGLFDCLQRLCEGFLMMSSYVHEDRGCQEHVIFGGSAPHRSMFAWPSRNLRFKPFDLFQWNHRTVPGVAGDHQALCETETGDWKRAASSHSRSPEHQRKGTPGGTGKAIGSSPRCYSGRPLLDLGKRTRHAGELGHHEPGDPRCGLETKQSELRQSERAIEEEPLSAPKLFK